MREWALLQNYYEPYGIQNVLNKKEVHVRPTNTDSFLRLYVRPEEEKPDHMTGLARLHKKPQYCLIRKQQAQSDRFLIHENRPQLRELEIL